MIIKTDYLELDLMVIIFTETFKLTSATSLIKPLALTPAVFSNMLKNEVILHL